MNSCKVHLSSAHFDTSAVALQCCLTELWVHKWVKVLSLKVAKDPIFKPDSYHS